MLAADNACSEADRFLRELEEYPGGYSGRGIVTCGGGVKYGTCAYVLIRLLRELGGDLPIEVLEQTVNRFDDGLTPESDGSDTGNVTFVTTYRRAPADMTTRGALDKPEEGTPAPSRITYTPADPDA